MKLIHDHIERWGRGDVTWTSANLGSALYNCNCADQDDIDAYFAWLNGRNVFYRHTKTEDQAKWIKLNENLSWPALPHESFSNTYLMALYRRTITDAFFEKRELYGRDKEKRDCFLYKSLTQLHPVEFKISDTVSMWCRREKPHGARNHLSRHIFYISHEIEDAPYSEWHMGHMDISIGPDGTNGHFASPRQNDHAHFHTKTYNSMISTLEKLARGDIDAGRAYNAIQAEFDRMRADIDRT
jgi:hypothetical protein